MKTKETKNHFLYLQINQTLASFGRTTLVWGLIAIGAAFLLAGFEYVTACALQILFESIGLIGKNNHNFIQRWIPVNSNAWFPYIFLISAGLVRGFAQFISFQSAVYAKSKYILRFRAFLLQRMLWCTKQNMLSTAKAAHLSSTVFDGAGLFTQMFFQSASLFFQSVAILAFMFFISPIESLLGLGGCLVIGLLGYFSTNKSRTSGKISHVEELSFSKTIVKISKNWFLIKIANIETSEMTQNNQSATKISKATIHAGAWHYLGVTMAPFLGIILLATITFFVRTFELTNGENYFIFVYLFIRLVQTLADAISALTYVTQQWPRAKECNQLYFEVNHMQKDTSIPDVKSSRKRTGPPAITANKLTFFYDPLKAIFKDLSFEIKSGQQIGIIGASGAGKTSLLSLILGFETPSGGKLAISSSNQIIHSPLEELCIGYVGPEPYLMEGTLIENIRFGNHAVTEEQISKAAVLTGFDQILRGELGSRDGLTEQGDGLSAGEKQRLCLTRALAQQPDLLILDEATANIDLEAEKHILESINSLKGKVTTLIVSHRPSTLKNCDQIISLNQKVS